MVSGISVVIPYFNSDQVFRDSFESVLSQSFVPSEIIVVNDGSCEDSRRSLDEYTDRCRVIDLPENRGVAAARNEGVRNAVGEYVAFLDSDDKWAPDKLEKQLQHFADNPECDGVHTGVAVFNREQIIAEYLSKPSPLTLADLLRSSHVTPPSFMVKRSAFLELGGYDESFRSSEDYDFSIRFVAAGKRIDFIPEPLTFVRREGHGNLSSKWMNVYRGHLKIVWRHRRLYRTVLGRGAFRVQCAKHTARAGQQRGGIIGKSLYCLGKCLAFPKSAGIA